MHSAPRLAVLGAAPDSGFPPVAHASRDPDGLLAAGGDLAPRRLLDAYANGIFPWFSQGQPILWWSPDPRMLFDVATFTLPQRFQRQLRGSPWILRADTVFAEVIDACAHVPRPGQAGTWITPAMREAYVDLHRLGHAHSVEVFDGARLVGGIYGVAIGTMFFGESMFSAQSGGSKAALAGLLRQLHAWGWPLLDAQVANPHLASLGATAWPRERFIAAISDLVRRPGRVGAWSASFGDVPAALLGPRG